MAEMDKRINFYLAGLDPSGANARLHNLMAESAESNGGNILNPHRANSKELINIIKEKGLGGEINLSWPKISVTQVFSAFYGVRDFYTGVELERLNQLGVPGIIFIEQSKFVLPIEQLNDQIRVITSFSRADSDTISKEIEDLMVRSKSMEIVGLSAEAERTEQIKNYLRTQQIGKNNRVETENDRLVNGDLELDEIRKSLYFTGNQLRITPLKFSLIQRLFHQLDKIVPWEELLSLTLPLKEQGLIRTIPNKKRVLDAIYEVSTTINDNRYFEFVKGQGAKLNDVSESIVKYPNGIVQWGKWKIDLVLGKVTLEDKLINLGPVQRKTVLALIEKRGEASPTQDLAMVVNGGYGDRVKETIMEIRAELNTQGFPARQYLDNKKRKGYWLTT